MALNSLAAAAGVFVGGGVSAFAPAAPVRLSRLENSFTSTYDDFNRESTATRSDLVDVSDECAPRDVRSMERWALRNGVRTVDGAELRPSDGTASDWGLVNARSPIPAGSPVLFVPSDLVLSSDGIADEFGGTLEAAENELVQMDGNAERRLPLFRLVVKLMAEYDAGTDSPYYPWLNSLPRQFYNGVSMTDECFECLPPYAAMLSKAEKDNYSSFVDAIRDGYVPVEESTINDDRIVKWAYNVALTRFHEVWHPSRQKLIAPMADMLNHSSEPNVEIMFDEGGNCIVQALYDIEPGSPLTISLGDPTNPTPLFAKYGFLTNDCSTLFCKALHLDFAIKQLGYDYKDLLIDTQSGQIAPKVWDIFLFDLLLEDDDVSSTEGFYLACKSNDHATKQQYHDHYFPYTLDSLKRHVYSILGNVGELTARAGSLDPMTHPRAPVIVAHNTLVQGTFAATAVMLEQMG